MRKVLSIVCVLSLVLSFWVFGVNSVDASGNVSGVGFIHRVSFDHVFNSNTLHVMGDGGQQFRVLTRNVFLPQGVGALRQRVRFEGPSQVIPSSLREMYEGDTVLLASSLSLLDASTDSRLREFRAQGVFNDFIGVKNTASLWSFAREGSSPSTLLFRRELADVHNSPQFNFLNATADVVGWQVISSGLVILREVRVLSHLPPQPETPDQGMQFVSLSFRLGGNLEKSDTIRRYTATDLRDGERFTIVFERGRMGGFFPTGSLQGEVISVQGQTSLGGGSGARVLRVHRWSFFSNEANRFSVKGRVATVEGRNRGEIRYRVVTENGATVTLLFRESLLAGSYPSASLSNRNLIARGSFVDGNPFSLVVQKYVLTEGGEAPSAPTPPPVNEVTPISSVYLGTLGRLMSSDGDGLVYAFHASSGEEFLAHFLHRRLPGPLRRDWEGVNIRITASIGGKNILTVSSFEILPDTFKPPSSEVVSIVGQFAGEGDSEGQGRVVRGFISESGTEYVAIFDERVLGSKFRSVPPSTHRVQIFGVPYLRGGKAYLAVLSVRDLSDLEGDFGQVVDPSDPDATLGSLLVTVFPFQVVSQEEGTVVYRAVTPGGDRYILSFSEDILAARFPENLLLGREILIFGFFSEGAALEEPFLDVYYWRDALLPEEKDVERGVVGKPAGSSESAFEYEFTSQDGEPFTLVVPVELKESLLASSERQSLEGLHVSIYGEESFFRGSRVLIASAINILSREPLDSRSGKTVSFRGTLVRLVREHAEGKVFYAESPHGQYALLYFDKDFLQDAFPVGDRAIGRKVVVEGFSYPDGVVMVKAYSFVEVLKDLPQIPEPLFRETTNMPNLAGFSGLLSFRNTGESNLTLSTASNVFVLNASPEMRRALETHLGSTIFLRGERRPNAQPYWRAEIDVYDFSVICSSCNVLLSPQRSLPPERISPIPRQSFHTIQSPLAVPRYFAFGAGILESLFNVIIDPQPRKD